MIQAKWIDQALFEPAFINGNWLVHSVFPVSYTPLTLPTNPTV